MKDNAGEQNEPDLLAIRYSKGIPEVIVLIEVKSREQACKDEDKNSGIQKHIDCMEGLFMLMS